jgi:preprotein translocase subunit SecY
MANPIAPFWKSPELKSKVLFTLLALLVYRLGAHITAPGIDLRVLEAQFGQFGNTLFGVYDMFVGGALSRATVFALGIMPYISSSIIYQLLAAIVPSVEKMQKEGEEGRKKLTQWTRYTTVVLGFAQGYGYAVFLQGTGAVQWPGYGFLFSTAAIMTTGAVFVMWLGEQITERGVGNGASLLIFFSIIEGFPGALATTFESLSTGVINVIQLLVLGLVMIGVIAGTVAMTMAARRLPVQIPRKVMGRGRVREGQKSFIPLRLNSAGVMPIIFAQSIIIVPGTLAAFLGDTGVLGGISRTFQPGEPAYYISYTILIVFFSYFYTSIVFNPIDLAENLKKQGAFIPGVKPGRFTADYIDTVLTRITVVGAAFLAAIALIPFLVFELLNMPMLFFFGGTSLLIVVGVALDTVTQMQQHLLLRHYEGFMKKGRVRFRGRQRYM